MQYDAENLAYLEGEARAAAHWLGLALKPVTARLDAAVAAFDVLAATADEARAHQELRALLTAMQAYCEAAGLLNTQLSANATAAEETAHREASRAATFLHEIRLMHAELQAERDLSNKQYQTFQTLLLRRAA